jgi:hypothetical protein
LQFVSIFDTNVKNIPAHWNKPRTNHVHPTTRAFRASSSFPAIAKVAAAFNVSPHIRAFFGHAHRRVAAACPSHTSHESPTHGRHAMRVAKRHINEVRLKGD